MGLNCLWIVYSSVFEVLYLVFWEISMFNKGLVPALARVNLVEKVIKHERTVELENSFETVWNSISGKAIELVTEHERTPFVVKAKMAKRRGSSIVQRVLVFLKNDGSCRLKECSRCYMEDWGYYFNHLGKDGQRVGMYTKAVDFLAS